MTENGTLRSPLGPGWQESTGPSGTMGHNERTVLQEIDKPAQDIDRKTKRDR